MSISLISTTAPEALALDAQLQAFYERWTRRDEAAIRLLFADHADLKIWGTDHFERIFGRDEADRVFASWIATCPPWVEIAPTHRVGHVYEGVAWAADDVEGRWIAGASSGVNFYRVTTIWEAIDGEWLIVHANVASPD